MVLTDYFASKEDIWGVNQRIDKVEASLNHKFDILDAKITDTAKQTKSDLMITMGKMFAWHTGITITVISTVVSIVVYLH